VNTSSRPQRNAALVTLRWHLHTAALLFQNDIQLTCPSPGMGWCYRVLSYRRVIIGIFSCSIDSYCCDVFRVMLMKQRVSSQVKRRCLHLNVLSHESPRCARLHTGHRLRSYTSRSKEPSHAWVDLLFCYSMQIWGAVKTLCSFYAVVTVLCETLKFSRWILQNSATTLSFSSMLSATPHLQSAAIFRKVLSRI